MEAEVKDVVEEVRKPLWCDGLNLMNMLGKRSRYELGSNYLPKCQRDGPQCKYT